MSANIILVGNVTKEPMTKAFGSGTLSSFSVANNKKEGTDYYNVTAFGKLSETTEKYVQKGMKVLVQGVLEMREYEKDGVKHSVPSVTANSIEFLSKGKEDTGSIKSDDELPF